MIYLYEVQDTVNDAYKTLARLQYLISKKEPVSGDIRLFNKMYTLSTKIVANLEYINTLNIDISAEENQAIEGVIQTLRNINLKIKETWL